MTLAVALRALAVAFFLAAVFLVIRVVAVESFKIAMALALWVGLSFGMARIHLVIYQYVMTGRWEFR